MNAHSMSANIPVLFRTYQSHEIHSGCTIWQAARATSAAPTFFKRIEIGREQPFIDGGLGCNNPSRLLLNEAKGLFGARKIGCLVSIGTGQAGMISIKKPGIFQQFLPTGVIDALKAIASDCEGTHEAMQVLFENSPNTYFRLNVEQGMQRIQLSEWEKLADVEALTTHYMKKQEVDEKLALLMNAISVPRVQITVKQLSTEIISIVNLKINSILLPQFLPGLRLNQCNMSINASSVRFRWLHLRDEKKSLTSCTGILNQMAESNASSCYTALGGLGRANLLSNFCRNPRSTSGTFL